MKTLPRILIIALLFIAAIQGRALGQTPTDEIWVDIRCQDKGVDQAATEYYGTIHKADFAAIMANAEKPNAFLKLSHVAWMEDGQIFQLSDTMNKGTKYGFKNVMFIRADSILRIVELDEAFVNARLLPLKE